MNSCCCMSHLLMNCKRQRAVELEQGAEKAGTCFPADCTFAHGSETDQKQ